MQIIKNWLNGDKNFIAGRVIYRMVGKDEALKQYFETNTDNQAHEKLIAALAEIISPQEKISTSSDTLPQPAPEPLKIEKKAYSAQQHMPDSTDKVLQAIKLQWLKPYKQMCYLQTQLDKFGQLNTQEAINFRKDKAGIILELEQQCIALWKQRDYVIEHGHLPDESDDSDIEIPKDPIELANLISRLKLNIRQNRNRMTKNPDNTNYAAKYLQYKEQFKKVTGKPYQEK